MVIICRYGELFLKGRNRSLFESVLVKNIISFMEREKVEGKAVLLRGRILIFDADDSNNTVSARDFSFLKYIFGLVSFSPALKVNADIGTISEAAVKLASSKHFGSFKVSSQRVTKTGRLSSIDINAAVGSAVAAATQKKVNLKKPDLDIGIEIVGDYAYIFSETYPCAGGLPTGSGEKVAVLYSPNIKSEASNLAAILMMKRGFSILCINVNSSGNPTGITPDISILNKFYPNSIKLINTRDLEKLGKEIMAIVVPESQDKTRDIAQYSGLACPTIEPLAGMSGKEITERYNSWKYF